MLILFNVVMLAFIVYIGYRLLRHHRRKKEDRKNSTALCPKCGSANGQMIGSNIIFAPSKYKCRDCDYEGVFLLVINHKVKEFREYVRKQNQAKKIKKDVKNKKN